MSASYLFKGKRLTMNRGFTILEIIIVVVILGILASTAIPKLLSPNDQILSSEGRQTLVTLLSAQKRYALENGNAYAAAMASLDVTIPASSYFDTPTLNNNAAAVASVGRTGGAYTLVIDDTGVITCSGVSCSNINCNKNPGGNRCN
jgi:prepilin-type N-terminal cleavage/methylation domain-containing protein